MSIASYLVRSEYTGNGTLASYTFNFKIASTSHIIVMVTNATFVTTFRVRGTDVTYLTSVTFDAVAGGGTVVLASNLPSGHFLTILLANDEPLQASEFKNKSDFTLSRFESALDVQAGAIQRLAYLVDRSLKISDSVKDAQTFDPTIPIHNTTVGTENNVDKVFCVGDDNASIKMGPTIVSLAAQAAAAAASAAAALVSEGAASSSAAAALISQNAAAASTSAALISQNAAAASAAAAAISAASIATNITGTRLAPTAITAGGGIAFSGSALFNTAYLSGSGGAVTITANPKIAAGTIIGQKLRLIVPTGANEITITDTNGVDLDGTLIMAAGSAAEFEWDGTNWFIISRRTA